MYKIFNLSTTKERAAPSGGNSSPCHLPRRHGALGARGGGGLTVAWRGGYRRAVILLAHRRVEGAAATA